MTQKSSSLKVGEKDRVGDLLSEGSKISMNVKGFPDGANFSFLNVVGLIVRDIQIF